MVNLRLYQFNLVDSHSNCMINLGCEIFFLFFFISQHASKHSPELEDELK